MKAITPDKLAETFLKIFEGDRRYISPWMARWDYQVKRKRGKANYGEGIVNEFFQFSGPQDLVNWMNWFSEDYPDYLPKEMTSPLLEKSRALDEKILGAYGLSLSEVKGYDRRAGINNVHDYLFPNLMPLPERFQVKRVLDFGAGYGRVSNLWSQQVKDLIFVGVDAIPNSYCLQHLYYSQLGLPFSDYIADPAGFRFDGKTPGIYHVPTWRTDLLPDNSIDMVNVVQVFQELNGKLVRHMLQTFKRVLRPGGLLYIRDHGDTWRPAHKMNVDRYLTEIGFDLEYKAHIVLDMDLHGIPRIFRKRDPEVVKARTYSFAKWKNQLLFDLRSMAKKLGPKKG